MKRMLLFAVLTAGLMARPSTSSARNPGQKPGSRIAVANGDTMEVIHQTKSGDTWVNEQRTVITAGTDFQSLSEFIDSLFNVTDLPEEIFYGILNQPFEAGFYMLTQQWSESEWENGFRVLTAADPSGLLATLTMQSWAGTWRDVMGLEYAYDAQSRLEEVRIQSGAEGSLQYVLRMRRSYNDIGKPDSDLIDIYGGGQWQNSLSVQYTYDEDGNLIERASYIDAVVALFNVDRIQCSYDDAGNITQRITQRGQQTAWINVRKESLSYDAQNNLTGHLFQSYENGAWQDSLRRTYQYNASNKQTHVLVETSSDGSWENESQTQTTYENGNAVEEIHQDWQGSWVNQERITTAYDNQNRPVIMIIYDWLASAWEEEEQYLFNYESPTRVENKGASLPADFQLSNYPNPFNPATTIRVELGGRETVTLTVLDVRGRLVRTLIHDRQMHAGKHEIVWNGRDGSGLAAPSGVYLIRLQGRSRTRTERCLLLK